MIQYKKQSFLCSNCAKISDTPQEFALHHRQQHDGVAKAEILENDVYMCTECDCHFASEENYLRHEKEKHLKGNVITLVDEKPPISIVERQNDNQIEDSELSARKSPVQTTTTASSPTVTPTTPSDNGTSTTSTPATVDDARASHVNVPIPQLTETLAISTATGSVMKPRRKTRLITSTTPPTHVDDVVPQNTVARETVENVPNPQLTETSAMTTATESWPRRKIVLMTTETRRVADIDSVKLSNEPPAPLTPKTLNRKKAKVTGAVKANRSDVGTSALNKVNKIKKCNVCNLMESDASNAVISCHGCQVYVHQGCYSLRDVNVSNPAEWLCSVCTKLGLNAEPQCALCPNLGGAMKGSKDGNTWAHVSCVLLNDAAFFEVKQKLDHVNIDRVPKSTDKDKDINRYCCVCEKQDGSCLQCTVPNCIRGYHVTCALLYRDKFNVQMKEITTGSGTESLPFCIPHSNQALRSLRVALGTELPNVVVEETAAKRRRMTRSSSTPQKEVKAFSNVTFFSAVQDDKLGRIWTKLRNYGAVCHIEGDNNSALGSYDYVVVDTFMKSASKIKKLRASDKTKLSEVGTVLWAESCLKAGKLLATETHSLYRPLVVAANRPLADRVIVLEDTFATTYSHEMKTYLRELVQILGAVCQGQVWVGKNNTVKNGCVLYRSTHYIAAFDDQRNVLGADYCAMKIVTHSWLVQTAIDGVKANRTLHRLTKDTNVSVSDTSLAYRRTDDMWKKCAASLRGSGNVQYESSNN